MEIISGCILETKIVKFPANYDGLYISKADNFFRKVDE